MKLTKKEKTLILILLLLVYCFVFVKFVVMAKIPEIQASKLRLEETKAQLAALEADYLNLESFRAELQRTTVHDERLGDYLMNRAGLTDSVQFVEKLALLIGTELKSISLGSPNEITDGDVKYYGFPISFSMILPYEVFEEVLQYCEGGSRKVRVSDFSMQPATEQEAAKIADYSHNQLFSVNMKLVFYALDKKAADEIFQYTRSAFKKLSGSDLFIREDEALPELDKPTPSVKPITTTAVQEITRQTADFIVFHRGYLYSGYNFETFASFNSKERVQEKVSGPMDVLLYLDKDIYKFTSVDDRGVEYVVTGSIPSRDYTMYIESDVNANVPENKGQQVNLKIQNDSGRNIRVKIDKKGDRLKVMNRNGNEINGKDEGEKVYY